MKKPRAMNYKACYYGDDFGGHNIPFPPPQPPKPDPYYDDCFYDMSPHIGQLFFENPYALKEDYWAKKKADLVVIPTLQSATHTSTSQEKTPQICPLMAAKATLAAHGYETTPVAPHTQTAQQYTPVVHSSHTSHSVTHYPNTAPHSFPVTHSFPIAHAPRTLTYNATPTHKISH